MYPVGHKLPNGATVIYSNDKYVLARWDKPHSVEWVVWRLTSNGATITGSYTPSLQRAVEIWIERTGACI